MINNKKETFVLCGIQDVPLNFEAIQNAYAGQFGSSDPVKIFSRLPEAVDLTVTKKISLHANLFRQQEVSVFFYFFLFQFKNLKNDCAKYKSLVYVMEFSNEDVTQITLKMDKIMTEFSTNCINDINNEKVLVYLISNESIERHRRQLPVRTMCSSNIKNDRKTLIFSYS
jgi:hypothetical protein